MSESVWCSLGVFFFLGLAGTMVKYAVDSARVTREVWDEFGWDWMLVPGVLLVLFCVVVGWWNTNSAVYYTGKAIDAMRVEGRFDRE